MNYLWRLLIYPIIRLIEDMLNEDQHSINYWLHQDARRGWSDDTDWV
jgi:hypothetical protein